MSTPWTVDPFIECVLSPSVSPRRTKSDLRLHSGQNGSRPSLERGSFRVRREWGPWTTTRGRSSVSVRPFSGVKKVEGPVTWVTSNPVYDNETNRDIKIEVRREVRRGESVSSSLSSSFYNIRWTRIDFPKDVRMTLRTHISPSLPFSHVRLNAGSVRQGQKRHKWLTSVRITFLLSQRESEKT